MNKNLLLALAGAGALFLAEEATAEDAKDDKEWAASVSGNAGFHSRQHGFGIIFTDHHAISAGASAGYGPFHVGVENFMWDDGLYEVDSVLGVGGPVGPFNMGLTGIYVALPKAEGMEPRGLGVLIGNVGYNFVDYMMVWDLQDGVYGQVSFDPTMPAGDALTLGLHSEFAFNAGCLTEEGHVGGHFGVGASANIDLFPRADNVGVSLGASAGVYAGWLGDVNGTEEEREDGWFAEPFADLSVTVSTK